ncbi:TonB-dependent receptor domain-containing protein, partial [Klebsiella pneumoniae]|uniref:TonB-dependent receptor domain-containing protein n=1 Tax=Klebsiella pneumoniae TaxID=573 RepID=UPI0013D59083
LGNGISINASYTHLNLVTVKGSDSTIGKMPSGIPGDSFSLWANYAVPPGDAWSGFSIGAGLRYTGFTYGDDQNSFRS